jgi:hypothetical protein
MEADIQISRVAIASPELQKKDCGRRAGGGERPLIRGAVA